MNLLFSFSEGIKGKAIFLLAVTLFTLVAQPLQAAMQRERDTDSTVIKSSMFLKVSAIVPQIFEGAIAEDLGKWIPVRAGTTITGLLSPSPDAIGEDTLASNVIPMLIPRRDGYIYNALGRDTVIYRLGGSDNGSIHLNVFFHDIHPGDAPEVALRELNGRQYFVYSLAGSIYQRHAKSLYYLAPLTYEELQNPNQALSAVRAAKEANQGILMATHLVAQATTRGPARPAAPFALYAPVWVAGEAVMSEIVITSAGVFFAETLAPAIVAFCIYAAPVAIVVGAGWIVWSHRQEIADGLRGVWRVCEYYARRHYLARLAAASAAILLTVEGVRTWRDAEVIEHLIEEWAYDDIEKIREMEDWDPEPEDDWATFLAKVLIYGLSAEGIIQLRQMASEATGNLKILLDEFIRRLTVKFVSESVFEAYFQANLMFPLSNSGLASAFGSQILTSPEAILALFERELTFDQLRRLGEKMTQVHRAIGLDLTWEPNERNYGDRAIVTPEKMRQFWRQAVENFEFELRLALEIWCSPATKAILSSERLSFQRSDLEDLIPRLWDLEPQVFSDLSRMWSQVARLIQSDEQIRRILLERRRLAGSRDRTRMDELEEQALFQIAIKLSAWTGRLIKLFELEKKYLGLIQQLAQGITAEQALSSIQVGVEHSGQGLISARFFEQQDLWSSTVGESCVGQEVDQHQSDTITILACGQAWELNQLVGHLRSRGVTSFIRGIDIQEPGGAVSDPHSEFIQIDMLTYLLTRRSGSSSIMIGGFDWLAVPDVGPPAYRMKLAWELVRIVPSGGFLLTSASEIWPSYLGIQVDYLGAAFRLGSICTTSGNPTKDYIYIKN